MIISVQRKDKDFYTIILNILITKAINSGNKEFIEELNFIEQALKDLDSFNSEENYDEVELDLDITIILKLLTK